jgi:hypothetical protein
MARRNPASEAAQLKRRGREGQPTEEDVPPPGVFPGRKPVFIPGQLGLGEESELGDDEDGNPPR